MERRREQVLGLLWWAAMAGAGWLVLRYALVWLLPFLLALGAAALLERLEPVLPEVVISREIGSGVVPMDPRERAWRELHGQVLRFLAERAKGVTRIFCGLPEVLK